MSTIPVICHADGTRFTVEASALTEDLRCACGSADIDLDETLETTAAAREVPPWVGSRQASFETDPEMGKVKETGSVKQVVRCSSCFTEATVTATDPAQPLPACPSCGSPTLSPGGSTLASRREAKIAEITRGIAATNPGMAPKTARQIAETTVARYPNMIGN